MTTATCDHRKMLSARPIRVLYFVNAQPGGAPYGVERTVLAQIAAMDPGRHEAIGAILPSDGVTADAFRAQHVPVLGTRLPTASMRDPRLALRFLAWGFCTAARLGRTPPDVIMATYSTLNRHAVLLSTMLRRPVVCSLYDTTPVSLYRTRWAYRCAAITTCSEALADTWRVIPEAASRLRVIYTGVEIDEFRRDVETRKRMRRELSVSEDGVLIGLVARLAPEKGIHDFVEAFALCLEKLPELRAVVVGAATSECANYRDTLFRRAQQLGLLRRMRFLGLRQDVAQIYSALDLLVLPSHQEGFGRVLAEGMAASLPIVATRVEGIPEVVAEGETGLLVSPSAPAELATAMLNVVSNPQAARAMGMAGLSRVRRRFSIESQVQATQQLLDEVAAPKPKRRRFRGGEQ